MPRKKAVKTPPAETPLPVEEIALPVLLPEPEQPALEPPVQKVGELKPYRDRFTKHLWSAVATVCCFVLMQIGTLVYWAGSISSRVSHVERALDRLEQRLQALEKATDAGFSTSPLPHLPTPLLSHFTNLAIMPTTPAGCLSLAQERLRTTLADVTAFRTWTGAADQAAALARIYHEGLPLPPDLRVYTRAELEALRPYAIIYTDPRAGFAREMEAMSDAYEYSATGRLLLRLYQTCPESLDDDPTSDANLQFRNSIGQIIDGLCDLSGAGEYLAFERIAVEAGPYWAHPKVAQDEGLWQGVDLSVSWRGI